MSMDNKDARVYIYDYENDVMYLNNQDTTHTNDTLLSASPRILAVNTPSA